MTSLVSRYYRWRSAWWRLQRILFPSPAEVRFIELLGGKVYKFPRIVNANGFCLTFVLTLGKTLKREKFKREVRIGKHWMDFANDLNWIIEVDGWAYHDIVRDFDRDIYLKEFLARQRKDCRILRIPAYRVFNNPSGVQRDVLSFFYR